MDSQNESFSLDEKLKNTEDPYPISQDSLITKLETLCMSSQEQNLSLSESLDFSIPSSTIFTSKKEEMKFPPSPSTTKNNSTSHNLLLNQKTILNCFNNQKMTIILQNILMEAKKEEIDNIINELFGYYKQIIKDKNGNYFCSDLFKIISQEQRIKILNELSSTICDDCIDKFGTHPIQTLIEFSSCEEEYKLLLNSFNDYNKLVFVSIDPNGSYVMTKIIEHIPEKFRTQFNLSYVTIFCFICTKKFGVINAKKFLDNTKDKFLIRKLIDLIKDNFSNISSNKYGNYLIQEILKKWWNTSEGEEIKEIIKSNIEKLSSNKYSSFIVNLYLQLESDEEKLLLMKNLKKNPNNDNININYKIMKSIGLFNNYENKNSSSHNYVNNNLKSLPLNNINKNNKSQRTISFKNSLNNNNIINNNHFPLSLNYINNNNINNNIINNIQIPFPLNNFNLNNNINDNKFSLLLGNLNKNPFINNAKD